MDFEPLAVTDFPPACLEGGGRFESRHLRSVVFPAKLAPNQATGVMRLVQETHPGTVSSGSPKKSGKWNGLTFRGLACAIEVVRIATDRTDVSSTLRFDHQRMRKAFDIMGQLGFSLPLLQVRLDHTDGDLVARVLGGQFSGASGQMFLFETFANGSEFMQHIYGSVLGPELGERLREEYRRAAPPNYGTFGQRYDIER